MRFYIVCVCVCVCVCRFELAMRLKDLRSSYELAKKLEVSVAMDTLSLTRTHTPTDRGLDEGMS